MKKIIGFLFVIIILGCGGYFVYVNYIKSKVPKLNLEEEVSVASKYYVYGNHFNIEGNIDIKDKNYFRDRYLKPLLASNKLQMTIPDKPNSKYQKYVVK